MIEGKKSHKFFLGPSDSTIFLGYFLVVFGVTFAQAGKFRLCDVQFPEM